MLIYGAIAAFGVLLLLGMLLVGEVFGGDHDVGGHDAGGHDTGGGHGDAGSPSIFSTRIMAAFFTAFGVGGVVARYYDLSHPASAGVGVICGLLMSGVVYQFAKLLYSQQASSELHMSGLVGTSAHVSVAIAAAGVGQVAVTAGGESSEHIARSADGQAVARGATVVITGLRGDSLIVTPVGSQAKERST
jgi:membrane protein implicated in regulation of membrane protease activity